MTSSSSVKKGSASAVKRRKEKKMNNTHHHDHHHHHHHHHHNHNHQENHQGSHQGDAKKEKKKYRLMRYDELPEYMKDNEFIIKYYRSEWPLKQAFFSLFQWHNETLNTWTHLLGFFLFLGFTVMIHTLPVDQVVDIFGIVRPFPGVEDAALHHGTKQLFMETANALLDTNHTNSASPGHSTGPFPPHAGAPRWPFYVFLTGSMFCLLSSSVCHLFSCHSHHVNNLLLRIDYVGITIMIITSFFPPIYYIFLCDRLWQILYLSGITLFGFFTTATLLSPTLSSGKCRAFRAMLFCSMGLFGLIPAIHASVVNWGNPGRSITLAYESAMALSYLTGTAFYVGRVPERFKPGWFDLAGHSHQIFHVFVILGALAHFGAGLVFLQWRDNVACEPSS